MDKKNLFVGAPSVNIEGLSNVTKWKILLLENGVKYSDLEMFNKIEDISQYKTKNSNIQLSLNNLQVFDISTNVTRIPSEVLISDGNRTSLTKLRFNINSPIEIVSVVGDKLSIKYNGQNNYDVNISLVKYNKTLSQNILTSDGHLHRIKDYVGIVGLNRITTLFYDGCYNWISGKNCKFCDLHPRRENEEISIPSINSLKDYGMDVKKWWDSQKTVFMENLKYSLNNVLTESNIEKLFLFFMAGNCKTNIQTWDIAEETISFLSKDIDIGKYTNYLNIAPHDNTERLKKLKDLGIKQVQYNLEVVGAERFSNICPGKMPYEKFENKLFEAVDIFGHGNVRSNFVFGLTPKKEMLDYAEYCARNGIVMDYSVFQPKKNTPFSNLQSPSFNEVIDFTTKLVKIYKENNLKPIFDSNSSRSSIVNELYEEINK